MRRKENTLETCDGNLVLVFSTKMAGNLKFDIKPNMPTWNGLKNGRWKNYCGYTGESIFTKSKFVKNQNTNFFLFHLLYPLFSSSLDLVIEGMNELDRSATSPAPIGSIANTSFPLNNPFHASICCSVVFSISGKNFAKEIFTQLSRSTSNWSVTISETVWFLCLPRSPRSQDHGHFQGRWLWLVEKTQRW